MATVLLDILDKGVSNLYTLIAPFFSGQGKLVFGDGSYYEGSFVDGEIEGHGFRVFGSTGCSYTGTE